jgi:hypothetical protein
MPDTKTGASWFVVRIRKIISVRSQAHIHADFPAGAPEVFYIGLGDAFDDERRMVREATATSRELRSLH